MTGAKKWTPQEDQVIEDAIRLFPHRTDLEIAAFLQGHPVLTHRSGPAIVQHVPYLREKLNIVV